MIVSRHGAPVTMDGVITLLRRVSPRALTSPEIAHELGRGKSSIDLALKKLDGLVIPVPRLRRPYVAWVAA